MKRSPHADFLTMALEIARHHHERFDGSGYPDGLRGLEIPLSARIVAVADVFDALTSVRCYKEAVNAEEARAMVLERSGKHFDPVVVRAFEESFGEFQRILARLGERREVAVVV
jgi:putative two-component system response regulator